MKQAFVIAALFLASSVAVTVDNSKCGQFPERGFDDPDMSSFVGHYSNPNYMFAVTIPDGLVGHDVPPPLPQHGFGVVISLEPRRYFWFDSSANALEWANEKEALADRLSFLGDEAKTILSVKEQSAMLGKQPGRQQTAAYVCPKSPLERVQVVILSLRRRGLVDQAVLLTTRQHFDSDHRLFMQAVRSWRVTGKY